MFIHLTEEELTTSYLLFAVTHITLWAGGKAVKQFRKGISVEIKAVKAHHVTNKHQSRFGKCTEDLCISLAGKARPGSGQEFLPQMETRQL